MLEDRLLKTLAVSRTGILNPKEIRQRGLPVVMIQAGIHPGVSDGKDAGFMVLRDTLSGKIANPALAKRVLLFAPVLSADDHERPGSWNRANHNGLEERGWRANAQNLKLNCDYTKVDTAQVPAMRSQRLGDPAQSVEIF